MENQITDTHRIIATQVVAEFLRSAELSAYQKFVKKELDKAKDKSDMGKLMKEIAKKWNAEKKDW